MNSLFGLNTCEDSQRFAFKTIRGAVLTDHKSCDRGHLGWAGELHHECAAVPVFQRDQYGFRQDKFKSRCRCYRSNPSNSFRSTEPRDALAAALPSFDALSAAFFASAAVHGLAIVAARRVSCTVAV